MHTRIILHVLFRFSTGAHGIILMYDVTDRETFDSISHWLAQIKEHADAKVGP